MPFITVFALLALEELLAKTPLALRFQALALGGFASVCIVISVVFYFIVVVQPSRAFSDDLTHRLKSLAEYVKASSEEDAVVAAADIGYLAFYSDRRILDLGGLVEPEMGKLREQYTYEEIIQKGLYLEIPKYPRVDYFIDREKMPNRFDGRLLKGHRFESVLVKRIDNLGIRRPGPYYYTLYRVHPEGNG
jgi:hypothetical protein